MRKTVMVGLAWVGLLMLTNLLSACTASQGPESDGSIAAASYEARGSGKIESILAYYHVARMDRAIEFYGHKLGLPLVKHTPRWAMFEVGGTLLGLRWTGGTAVPRIDRSSDDALAGGTVTLRTSNLAALLQNWANSGVTFLSRPTEYPWGKIATFEDPDGNVLRVVQLAPARTQRRQN
jgi:catechol 2,3-dioxygenase-like lactoylglutathione lyase family enzyme